MKVLVTGATGLIGQEIVKLCHQSNIDVNYLTTNKNKLKDLPNYKGYYWNPSSADIDTECFRDVEVIINLVGSSIAKLWTTSYKKEILDSRVNTIRLIMESLESIEHSVRHFISASAIGIYPDSFQNYYMEDSPEKDTGFLGEVVVKWEEAASKFKALDIEVSILRIGLVLSNKGGAFPKIVKPIKYGLGAVFGNGKQWQSWIHVEDLARMFMFVMQEELFGVFNAVAPNAVSNRKLTYKIAKRVNKRIILPSVPRLIFKLVLGEMHILLFSSQRVCSGRISESGFKFEYDNIELAIANLIEA
ncbi:TIGR01777 family oxidoreductase [Aquimarina gracilis]|uniref:TIGR01777 family oxidoreductase n=1 Tax=Aquimarina gracilis TaxID=874422 RepID=A0ABU5ZRM3_9FLAO|nr:TIGR01777 family oxidoreductase [Aquimarina gracilis]MEB3344573.1 TIGR01777 family oxidoreductase [Aquimarina gracilis]